MEARGGGGQERAEGVEDVGGRAVIGDRVARERPVLGICIGMQVLFDTSEEGAGTAKGLAALGGRVRRLDAPVLPHITLQRKHPHNRTFLGHKVQGRPPFGADGGLRTVSGLSGR